MRYIANPVTVEAKRITRVSPWSDQGQWLKLEDGSPFLATREMTSRMAPQIGDYVVTQEDGYVYLNPKDVFERKYRPADALEDSEVVLENGRLSFSDALEMLKAGHRVAREVWGQSRWLSLSPGTPGLPAEKFWSPHNRAFAERIGGTADVLPTISMKTADDKILMGWTPGGVDLLSDDWFVERINP